MFKLRQRRQRWASAGPLVRAGGPGNSNLAGDDFVGGWKLRARAWTGLAGLLVVVGLSWGAATQAQNLGVASQLSTLPSPVKKFLDAKKVPLNSISVFVQGVDDRAPLLSYNADVPRNPASVMKVVTTLAGLELLGPAYRWRTDLRAADPLVDGRLQGPLYMKGRGDPMLITKSLWWGLRSLRDLGLRDITGGLVVDQSAFQVKKRDPGAFDGQRYRAYNVLPQASLINYNAVLFYFHPEPEQNRVRIAIDPPSTTLQVVNKLSLASGKCRGMHRKVKMNVLAGAPRPKVEFNGTYPASCGVHTLLRSIEPDEHYIFGTVDVLWRELGGTLKPAVRVGRPPKGSRLLAQIQSDPLAEVIRGMNKYSNNVMTRQLFLTIGREVEGWPGTVGKARTAIGRWVKSKGIDANGFFVDNGSGLSRTSRLTVRQLGRLLVSAYHSPLLGEFIGSLPLAATDGTMRKRFKKSPLAGRVRMKTGLIRDVRAGAGYLWNGRNKAYVVAILHNHKGIQGATGNRAQDELLEWLYAYRQ